MPLYEYACPGCGARFEKLVRRFGEAVACPECAATDVEKQLSVFAVGAPSPPFAACGAAACSPEGGGCGAGACGGGSCPLE